MKKILVDWGGGRGPRGPPLNTPLYTSAVTRVCRDYGIISTGVDLSGVEIH